MTVQLAPIITQTTYPKKPLHHGYEGIIVWVESGAQIYVWENLSFLTVDVYSCKPYDNSSVISFIRKFFDVLTLEYKEVKIE